MIARFMTGMGTGMDTSTVPMYQAELCDAHKRGRLVCSEPLFVGVGKYLAINLAVLPMLILSDRYCNSILFRLWYELCRWSYSLAVAHCVPDDFRFHCPLPRIWVS